MKGEQRKHAGIPIPDPVSLLSKDFVLDVEAPACRTEIGAGSAVDAGKGNPIPERSVEELVDPFFFKLLSGHRARDFLLRRLGQIRRLLQDGVVCLLSHLDHFQESLSLGSDTF